jgi:ABC-2 type transport system ATP-binding protein
MPIFQSSMPHAIEVTHLTKVYGDLRAVDDISFSVQKGEVFAFLGPNGAGKTTTVEMIETIRTPTAGTIRVLGHDISKNAGAIKERIGVLPQEFASFDRLTVRETLQYFSNLYDSHGDIDHIIDLMDLSDKEHTLYHTLSGGLKQRVGVAISLVNDPDIVFLDEPTTGLDPRARRDVWHAISELKQQGKTVFLTTHYMEEAEYLADTITIIHRGRIIAQGTLEELVNRYGGKSTLVISGCDTGTLTAHLKKAGYSQVRISDNTVDVKINKRDAVIDILFSLREGGLEYREVDIKHADLEDVFLNLTGARLRGDEQ